MSARTTQCALSMLLSMGWICRRPPLQVQICGRIARAACHLQLREVREMGPA
jgi:hypothetical protein